MYFIFMMMLIKIYYIIADPFFERLAATTGDVTSSNRAFNATLPIHDETLALILRFDILILYNTLTNTETINFL